MPSTRGQYSNQVWGCVDDATLAQINREREFYGYANAALIRRALRVYFATDREKRNKPRWGDRK